MTLVVWPAVGGQLHFTVAYPTGHFVWIKHEFLLCKSTKMEVSCHCSIIWSVSSDVIVVSSSFTIKGSRKKMLDQGWLFFIRWELGHFCVKVPE